MYKVAVCGTENSSKSTIINSLAGYVVEGEVELESDDGVKFTCVEFPGAFDIKDIDKLTGFDLLIWVDVGWCKLGLNAIEKLKELTAGWIDILFVTLYTVSNTPEPGIHHINFNAHHRHLNKINKKINDNIEFNLRPVFEQSQKRSQRLKMIKLLNAMPFMKECHILLEMERLCQQIEWMEKEDAKKLLDSSPYNCCLSRCEKSEYCIVCQFGEDKKCKDPTCICASGSFNHHSQLHEVLEFSGKIDELTEYKDIIGNLFLRFSQDEVNEYCHEHNLPPVKYNERLFDILAVKCFITNLNVNEIIKANIKNIRPDMFSRLFMIGFNNSELVKEYYKNPCALHTYNGCVRIEYNYNINVQGKTNLFTARFEQEFEQNPKCVMNKQFVKNVLAVREEIYGDEKLDVVDIMELFSCAPLFRPFAKTK